MSRRFSGSIFRNLFSIFIVLILFMTAFNVSMTLFIRNRLLKDKMKEQNIYIDSYASFIDDTLEGLENVFTYLQRNVAVSRRSSADYRNDVNYLQNEMAIFNLLTTFSFTSAQVNEILICWDDSPYFYTSSGLLDMEVYFQNRFQGDYKAWEELLRGQYEQATLLYYQELIKDPQDIYVVSTDSTSIYLLKSIRIANQVHQGTLCIVLHEEMIQSIFSDRAFAEGREIFIMDSDGNIIASNTDQKLEDVLHGRRLEDIRNTSQYISNKGLLSHREAAIGGLEYIVFTPYEQISGTFDQVFLIANILSAAVVLVLMGYAFWSSRRMSKPFQGIINALGQPTKSREKESDIRYITSRVLDLLSANQSMNTALQSNSRIVLQSVMYKLLMGGPSVEETLATIPSYHNISLSEGLYRTAVVRIDLAHDEEERFYTEYHDFFEQGLREYMDTWLVEVLQTLPDEYTIVLCLDKATEQQELMDALLDMYESLQRRIPDSAIFIGLSNPIQNIRELRICYEQSVKALSSRPVQNRDVIVSISAGPLSNNIPFIPDDLEAQLRLRMDTSGEASLLSYINSVLEQNYQQNVTYEAYLSVCLTINRFIRRMVQSKQGKMAENLIPIRSSEYIYTVNRCREILLSNAKEASKLLVQAVPSVSIDEQITAYVDTHFREDINLSTVADELGYTANYISRYYKQANGVNFTDYLNSRRIAYSCELLATTSWTLKKIAEMSGFSGSNFFIKVFKKYEGITPGEYRKRMQTQKHPSNTTM